MLIAQTLEDCRKHIPLPTCPFARFRGTCCNLRGLPRRGSACGSCYSSAHPNTSGPGPRKAGTPCFHYNASTEHHFSYRPSRHLTSRVHFRQNSPQAEHTDPAFLYLLREASPSQLNFVHRTMITFGSVGSVDGKDGRPSAVSGKHLTERALRQRRVPRRYRTDESRTTQGSVMFEN